MAGGRKESTGVRQVLGNLLVAWTMVTGLALVFASAWYYRTGDIKILIAYLGAPFLVGTGLFMMIGIVSVFARTKASDPVVVPVNRMRRRSENTLHSGARRGPHWPAPLRAEELHPDLWETSVRERLSLEARPEEEDLEEYHRLVAENRHAKLALLVVGTAAIVAWAKLLVPEMATFDPLSVVPMVYLVACIVFLGVLLAEPRRLARRQMRRSGMITAFYRIGPEGLDVQDLSRRGRYSWGAIARVRETERLILLSTIDGERLLIPKRELEPSVLERLRAVLSIHVPGARAPLGGRPLA